MKQIHVNQVQISFCFIPKSYFWRSTLGTVVMDQHWKSVMVSVHNQRTSSSEIFMTYDIWLQVILLSALMSTRRPNTKRSNSTNLLQVIALSLANIGDSYNILEPGFSQYNDAVDSLGYEFNVVAQITVSTANYQGN